MPEASVHAAIFSISGANLSNANLNRASLVDANLTDADFSGALLIDADLSNITNLTLEKLKKPKIGTKPNMTLNLASGWIYQRKIQRIYDIRIQLTVAPTY